MLRNFAAGMMNNSYCPWRCIRHRGSIGLSAIDSLLETCHRLRNATGNAADYTMPHKAHPLIIIRNGLDGGD